MLVKGNKQGFTLIEVVIVLAIAALVLAGVFFAVTGAQTSRRDTQRKNDIGRIASYLEQDASNDANGAYPTNQANFATELATYTANMRDPRSGTAYLLTGAQAPSDTLSAGVTYTITGRRYSVCINLEQGGTSCRAN